MTQPASGSPGEPRATAVATLDLPALVSRLANGLTVVVSEDPAVPVFGMTVLYRVGSRLEPRGRSGFAHLFEHLMFEGTPGAPKGLFDRICESSGATNNGQTRPDATVYIESGLSSALERFLWLEADRMSCLSFEKETLDIQRDVVKEEIRVNVQNDPYGLFEYQELPALLFDKWENAHDGYGDFADLDAASIEDVKAFFQTFYRPNNAIVSIVSDRPAPEVIGLVEKYFGPLPPGILPAHPDISEPPRKTSAVSVREAPLARTPALVAGWRMPGPQNEDVLPLLILGELLHEGRSARLYKGLVEGRQIATEVMGGFNPFQGLCWYTGTTLFLSRIAYKRGVSHGTVLGAFAEERDRLLREGVPAAELERVKRRLFSSYLSLLENRLERSLELASATAFGGTPVAALDFPARISRVTSAEVVRAAERWLSPETWAVVVKEPPAGAAEEEE
ncbi:MAG: insulinase family protein [Thermoanaerobaculia bacterium]|nr:insulinase family protein [Thermoanaerobaculia bacterium]